MGVVFKLIEHFYYTSAESVPSLEIILMSWQGEGLS